MDADPIEIRVLGCLIEKQRTTPDAYPLSLNSLRLACNQSTNRDPIVQYDEATIRAALDRLSRRGWARLASGAGSRAIKFRHLFDEAMSLTGAEISLLTVLMLRGPQTPGELKVRSERMHPIRSLEELDAALSSLIERELVAKLPRRPGQKEQRYAHLLGDESAAEVSSAYAAEEEASTATAGRMEALEERVTKLEDEIASLWRALGESR